MPSDCADILSGMVLGLKQEEENWEELRGKCVDEIRRGLRGQKCGNRESLG